MRAGRSDRLCHHSLSPRSTIVASLSLLLDSGVATAAVARRMRRKEESIFLRWMLERWARTLSMTRPMVCRGDAESMKTTR